jgi:hypothetical protein
MLELDFAKGDVPRKEEDIEKIISSRRNREEFLDQLETNSEMLKEVFRLYLWESVEDYAGR